MNNEGDGITHFKPDTNKARSSLGLKKL